MKKTIFNLALISLALVSCKKNEETKKTDITVSDIKTTEPQKDSAHNAQNSLDWTGTYESTLPCADCEGIKTIVTLNQDGTYVIKETYLKKSPENETKGNIEWDATKSIITLKSKDSNMNFKIKEGNITLLDQEKKEMDGSFKDQYVFKKK